MPISRQIRWHLLLALSGALMLPIVPWQVAALVIGTLALAGGVHAGIAQSLRHRSQSAGRAFSPITLATRASPPRPRPALTRTRLPLALVRRLGAECALCEGLGCGECAESGLR